MTGLPESAYLFLGALALFVLFSAAVIAVLWIAMPFSVFGLKGLLKRAIEEQERTNALLSGVLAELRAERDKKGKDSPPDEDEKDATMH